MSCLTCGSILVAGLDGKGGIRYDDAAFPVVAMKTVDELIDLVRTESRTILIGGTPQNSKLVAELSAIGACVYVASPRFCRERCPYGLLQVDHSVGDRLSIPDWVRIGPKDSAAFALRDVCRDGTRFPTHTMEVAKRHPAWAAVSFVPGFDFESACRLLCGIGDPRWFRDPSRPNRLARLYAYLGLSGRTRGHREASRYEDILRLWFYPPRVPATPARFLWRTFVEGGGGDKGCRAASRRLIRFVHDVWLDTVLMSSVFDPMSYFGQHRNEAEAFAVYRAGIHACLEK